MNALHLAADATPIKRGSGLGHRIMNSMDNTTNSRRRDDPSTTEGDDEDEVGYVRTHIHTPPFHHSSYQLHLLRPLLNHLIVAHPLTTHITTPL